MNSSEGGYGIQSFPPTTAVAQSGEDAGDQSGSFGGEPPAIEDALELAERLVAVLRRLRSVERDVKRTRALQERLEELIRSGTSDEDLVALEAILSAWSERPNDLLVMVKISEQSRTLAGLVSAVREMRRVLSRE